MKVVPTVYEDLWGEQKISYQYTYAYKVRIAAFLSHCLLEVVKKTNFKTFRIKIYQLLLMLIMKAYLRGV